MSVLSEFDDKILLSDTYREISILDYWDDTISIDTCFGMDETSLIDLRDFIKDVCVPFGFKNIYQVRPKWEIYGRQWSTQKNVDFRNIKLTCDKSIKFGVSDNISHIKNLKLKTKELKIMTLSHTQFDDSELDITTLCLQMGNICFKNCKMNPEILHINNNDDVYQRCVDYLQTRGKYDPFEIIQFPKLDSVDTIFVSDDELHQDCFVFQNLSTKCLFVPTKNYLKMDNGFWRMDIINGAYPSVKIYDYIDSRNEIS